jgi:hypothetical protein
LNPNKGEHQYRFYGWYSNKKRGLREKEKQKKTSGNPESDTSNRKKCPLSWAALIRAVFEVNPLVCPRCGGTMKIISFIQEEDVIRSILKHCNLWKESLPRPPPEKTVPSDTELVYDYDFVEPA